MKILRPQLSPRATVGIVSPASWPRNEYLVRLKDFWECKGHPVYIHPQNYLKNGLLAGSSPERGKALMDVVTNPDIGAVMFSRGRGGSLQVVEYLDYAAIRKNAKPVIGFADTTTLLHAISRKSGLVTFYGPMGKNFADPENDPRTEADLITALTKGAEEYRMYYKPIECLCEGEAEGVLIGGHLNRMQLLLGTPYDCFSEDKKDVILFLETSETTLIEIDNALTQLSLAGKFQNVRGVILGEFFDIHDGETPLARTDERSYGHDIPEIVAKRLVRKLTASAPIVQHFPCGHGKYLSTMPIGSRVRMSAKESYVELGFKTA